MSQTRTQEQAAPQRVNFSDGNRELHLQTFFKWLPEEFHETPHIDWTRIPSKVIGYLVNTVGNSPFAVSLAIAAFAGAGPMREYALRQRLSETNCLLQAIQVRYGVQSVAGLTSSVWENYVTEKKLTPGDYHSFKSYIAFTEYHFPAYLEDLNQLQYARIEPYVLPPLPRKFRQQYLPAAVCTEGEKQRRKGKSDIIAPLHTLLVALVRFRKQNTQRLWSAYREALEQAKTTSGELPLPFSYEDEIVEVNHEAQTVKDVCLKRRTITLCFLLWDRQSWVKKHPNDYQSTTKRNADLGIKEFAQQQFFVECLNPADELLWFGDLIKYRLLQTLQPQNISPEDAQQRQQILAQLGIATGLTCTRDGILTPANDFAQVLSQAMVRTGTLVFDAESLYRGTLFASALATLALTNGSRMCELLQVSADRFKARPYVVKSDGHPTGEERVIRLQLLLPKGKHTEVERKLFPISDWSWDLLCQIAEELRCAHNNRIPVIRPHRNNSKSEDLPSERYLFQWDASTDGTLGAFSPNDVTNLLRFILYGLEFRTKEGEPFSVTVHLLRHVMANAARHEHAVSVEAVARALHHEYRPGMVPTATLYYSEATENQSLVAFAEFQTDLEVWAASLLVEMPDEQELAGMDDGLRESFEHWHTLLETTFGFCGNVDLCPRGYNRTLCIGCPHLVVDPRKQKHATHWRNAYAQFAEALEKQGNVVDARQYRLLVHDLDGHINEMRILQQAIDDGTRKPVFLQLPSTSEEVVIVDAKT